MSKESSEWLNRNTLIGFTDQRGHAWHYRADDQGAEPNHYDGPVPVADIRRRLFNWQPQLVPVRYRYQNPIEEDVDGEDDSRRVVVRPDTGEALGIVSHTYQVHDYDEWLVKNVEAILDSGLQIGSAGLLRRGAVAWVQAEMPETVEVSGIGYRPYITAATSVDGSMTTRYITGATVVVCDNTLAASLAGADTSYRVRHTAHSLGQLQHARDALGIVNTVSGDFAREVDELLNVPVTDAQWSKFLDVWSAPGNDTSILTNISPRQERAAQVRRDALNRLWADDERVTPWKGTAWGVVQAANTYRHHVRPVRGASRAERNMEAMVTAKNDRDDAATLAMLRPVLA